MSDHEPQPLSNTPSASGLLTALVCAALMIGTFVQATSTTLMPMSERWAALTTFGVIALAYAFQGSPELYDALGRTVRRDHRALILLLLLLPALYISYSTVVGEFTWSGVLTALVLAFLPTLAFLQSHQQRTPTLFDLVATLYLLLSAGFGLLPGLQLPQQGGVIGFFHFSAVPLMLLILAARGWPGLGFTWFLSWRDLRAALLGAGVLLVVPAVALAAGFVQPAATLPAPMDMLVVALLTYFLVALPQEILFRGLVQNGIERFAEAQLWRGPGSFSGRFNLLHPRLISLVSAALIFGSMFLYDTTFTADRFLVATIAGLCYGWVYQHTGKVTASAVTHMLFVWCWTILFV